MWCTSVIKDYLLHCSLLLFSLGFFGFVVDNYLFWRITLPYWLVCWLWRGGLALAQDVVDSVGIRGWHGGALKLLVQTFTRRVRAYNFTVVLPWITHHLLLLIRVPACVKVRLWYSLLPVTASMRLSIDRKASVRLVIPRLETVRILWLLPLSTLLNNAVWCIQVFLFRDDGVLICLQLFIFIFPLFFVIRLIYFRHLLRPFSSFCFVDQFIVLLILFL